MDSQRTNSAGKRRSVYPLDFGLCPAGILLLFAVAGYAKYDGGSGTPTDPYQIATPEQLYGISQHEEDWDKCFKLTANLDLSAHKNVPFSPIGTGYGANGLPEYGRWFRGVFDGSGHTISNFTFHSPDRDAVGLFGTIHGEVKNLGLVNVDISGHEDVGGLAGGVIQGGGNPGRVANCYVTGRVSGQLRVGGLIGRTDGNSNIRNCYSTAEVSGEDTIGGLVALTAAGVIYNSYAMGRVTAGKNGGALTAGNGGAVVGCFWDTATTGQGLGVAGQGRTTAQMKMAATYVGWGGCDSEGVWTLNEGKDYPRLAWEGKPGRLITGGLADILPGRGIASDPYLISTAEQLNAIGLFPCERNRHFRLMADIDLGAYQGMEFNRIGAGGPFGGSFDGNGHTISNFTYDSAHPQRVYLAQCIGLFAEIATGAVVKNLGLIDVDVAGYYDVGGLAGINRGGRITNCHVTGRVSAGCRGGGLIGSNSGAVTACWAAAGVSSLWVSELGGLVGMNDGTLSDCYATGAVAAEPYEYNSSGGLVGENAGQLSNCYATGLVSGPKSVVGGLVGKGSRDLVHNSFWDTQTTRQTASAGGTGKTTPLMMTAGTFTGAGWDFVAETANGTNDIWMMPPTPGYPVLVWEEEDEEVLVPAALLPMARWMLDESDGAKASDSAGTNDGTVQGARWSDGRMGGALFFDGLDDYVDCGSDPALAPERLTIAFWIWVDSRVSYQYPLGRISDVTPAQAYMFSTGGEGKLVFSFGLDFWKRAVMSSQNALPVRQWVHVVATRDGAAASLYLDGQFQDSMSYSFVPPNEELVLRIGSVGTTEGAGYFKGKLDDVRLYDRALTEEEIQELYQEAGQ